MSEIKFPSESGKLRVYFHISENSGVGLYRQYQWAKELMDKKLANVLINDFTWGINRYGINDKKGRQKLFPTSAEAMGKISSGEFAVQPIKEVGLVEPTMDTMVDIANWADILVVGRRDVGEYYATWGALKEMFNMPIVMDTDDNVSFVRPSNPGYASYGPNSEHLEWHKKAVRGVFDGLTVSTENLQNFYLKEHPKISVIPNSIDFAVWDKEKKRKKKHRGIRICFNGSSSHWEGARLIEQPIVRIMREFPDTIFIIPKVYSNIFEQYADLSNRIEYFDWVPLKDFAKSMAKLNIDIGLAPLADNMFNRAKSNLRWMEFSALEIPVICSPVEAYKNVVDKKTGLVALEKEEWYNAIKALVLDEPLRTTLAKNANNEVREKYNLEANAPKILPFYQDVVDKFHALLGPKKRFMKVDGGWREFKRSY